METVIRKLSEIEAAACRLIDSANDQKRVLDDELKQRIEAYDSSLELDTRQRLSDLQKDLQLQLDQELEALRSKTSFSLNALYSYYKQHHEQLAADICQKILRT